jgi:hypothetical protein
MQGLNYNTIGGHLTAKTKCRKFETNIPGKGISGPQSQFPHSCVCERIIYSHDGSAFSAGENLWSDPGNIYIAHRHMNVEIGAETAQFQEKEYINGIALQCSCDVSVSQWSCILLIILKNSSCLKYFFTPLHISM